MLDRIEAEHSACDRCFNRGRYIGGVKHFQQAQDLDELALARLAQTRLEQTPQGRKLLGQGPTDQRRGLIQRPNLPFQQRQIVQRIEDEVLALVRARVAGNLFRPRRRSQLRGRNRGSVLRGGHKPSAPSNRCAGNVPMTAS